MGAAVTLHFERIDAFYLFQIPNVISHLKTESMPTMEWVRVKIIVNFCNHPKLYMYIYFCNIPVF